LKPERWGSLLVQEKCQGEKACDKRCNHSIQFNSIQFNSGLLMWRVNSQKASYRNSTTYITTDSEQDTNETHNKTNKSIFK
jgi:hypothetical protein